MEAILEAYGRELARVVVANDYDWHEIVWHWVPDGDAPAVKTA